MTSVFAQYIIHSEEHINRERSLYCVDQAFDKLLELGRTMKALPKRKILNVCTAFISKIENNGMSNGNSKMP